MITVQTGARLHFGLFATHVESGRSFGGVGLMIDAPSCELTVARSDCDRITAPESLSGRLADWLTSYREHCPPEFRPLACDIGVRREIPQHVGLGAGTQSALALAAALTRLSGEPNVPITELARRVARGRRSAIGLHGFEQGGLLAEAGKSQFDEISPLQSRLVFPTDWRMVLVIPTDGRGLSGDSERSAFARLGPMPSEMTRRLKAIAERELLPAVAAHDFDATATALSEFGQLNGEYFAAVQGGLFADPRQRDLAGWLESRGCRGVGQSSWGPTLFLLCRDQREAETLRKDIVARMPESIRVWIAAARNRGADIAHDASSSQERDSSHATTIVPSARQ